MPNQTGSPTADVIDLRSSTYVPPAGYPEFQAWWQVNALGGNDTVYGSAFNDYISGGDGNDLIFGYAGNDSLYGDAGSDILRGGDGSDFLSGGADADSLYGDAGNDTLQGDAGDDYMEGGNGDDVLIGGAGNDNMIGGANNDTFFGDAGADWMTGGSGFDRAWGGAGNDIYNISGGGNDTINDGVTNTGSARTDTLFDTQDRVIVAFSASQTQLLRPVGSQDLWIVSSLDLADGVVNDGVKIENNYLGGHYTVEILQTSDGQVFSIPAFAP